jgi:hypothetical protein
MREAIKLHLADIVKAWNPMPQASGPGVYVEGHAIEA